MLDHYAAVVIAAVMMCTRSSIRCVYGDGAVCDITSHLCSGSSCGVRVHQLAFSVGEDSENAGLGVLLRSLTKTRHLQDLELEVDLEHDLSKWQAFSR